MCVGGTRSSRSIPVEDLASNGESMRGKVFHIACALCAQVGGGVDERGQELIKDWCNMVSAWAGHGWTIAWLQGGIDTTGAWVDASSRRSRLCRCRRRRRRRTWTAGQTPRRRMRSAHERGRCFMADDEEM
jgi:hypothetical protein